MTDNLLGGRYDMGDTLGYGGMSEVFRGRDVRLGRDVAIKVLRSDLARDPTFQTRFRREAQNAASLNHPAIVAVYDTGEMTRDGATVPYIVMEYVDGETLRDVVKREGPLAPQRAMEISADICAALDFSHRHGIIHRDVKPANVMLTRAGAVKVMDFGIARAATDGQSTVTATAAVIGTAQYLSPEQARGENVDARSDVYAAGCVLYELLTGDPPFTGDSPVAVAYQHVREEPKPPSALRQGVTRDLDAIVLKALNKNPLNRYQTAADMRSDLIRALSGQQVHATPVMDDDDRTEMLAAVPGGQAAPPAAAAAGTSILQPQDDWDDDDDARSRRIWGFVGIGVVCALLLAGAVFLTFKITGNSAPAEKIAVPTLTGKTPDEAAELLRKNHLVVAQPYKHDASSPDMKGKVIDQFPSPGVPRDQGSEVTLTIGDGVEQVSVPNVQQMKPDRAKNAIEDKNLHYQEKKMYSSTPKGHVAKQDPEPETKVKPSTTVTVWISQGTQMTTIPDKDQLVGVQIDDAKAALKDAHLSVVPQSTASDKPKGEVIGLGGGLKPGQTVQVDTVVTLMVSDNSEMKMPSLKNMKPDDAVKALQADDVGWKGDSSDLSEKPDPTADRALWGRITGQSPPADKAVPKDALVQVMVGQPPSMPDLSGMTEKQAQQTLESKGFRGQLIVTTNKDETAPPGKEETIIPGTQQPAAHQKIPASGPVKVDIYPKAPPPPTTSSTSSSSSSSSSPPSSSGGGDNGGGSGGGNHGGHHGGSNG